MTTNRRFKIMFLALTSLVLQTSCSSDDSSASDDDSNEIITEVKVLQSIGQSDFGNLNIQVENDKVTRLYSAGTTFYHHLNYNGTDRIQNIFVEGTGQPNLPFQGFDYDYISDSNRTPSIEFTYDGANISEINSESNGDFEFMYGSENRLEEVVADEMRYSFIYGQGSNPTAVLISEVLGSSQPERFELVFDDKINPFYTFWNDFGLPMSIAYGDLPSDAFVYFPNNLISMENLASQELFTITYQYDGDNHPTFYRYTDDEGRTRSGSISYF